ncbi:MAG TPA: helix-turn-helix domain-containing protein [Chloroflexota bacterium]|jgi:AcrR family transcriptional regulator|nr:helix-turn-helix domain-containing protein [Chloroflexota bacterium]
MAIATTHQKRLSADDHREDVLAAAVHEFAAHGYRAARTAEIAARAGISQPYIYALFRNKKALFLACQDRVRVQIRAAFIEALRPNLSPEQALRQLGAGYRRLLPDQDLMRCQLQGFAAAADPEIRDNVRTGMMASFDAVVEMTGASREQVAVFVALGLLLNVGAMLGLPADYLPVAPHT